MYELGLDVYLIPTDDPHMSKHVPMAYTRKSATYGIQWIGGYRTGEGRQKQQSVPLDGFEVREEEKVFCFA